MDPARKARLVYLVVIALLVAAAGALWYSYRQEIREAERLAAAMREVHQQRESLQAEVKALQSRAQELEGALESARAKTQALATEKDALAAGLSEKEQTLGEAKARSAELNQAYEALLKDKSQLAEASEARRAELERTRKAFEEVQNLIARLTGARGIYTVQYGDSLSKIAAFFYKDGRRWPAIFEANGHLIRQPDLIYPLQVLIVPQ